MSETEGMQSQQSKSIEALIQTVQALMKAQEAMLQRQDQMFKLLEDRMNEVVQATESIKTTNQALTQSLSESDQQLDDLAEITQLLLQTYQDLKNEPVEEGEEAPVAS